VRLISHSPAIRHLAWSTHSRGTDLDVSVDLYPDPGRIERVGNAPGKGNKRAGQQARVTSKARAGLDSFVPLRLERLCARINPSPLGGRCFQTKTKRVAQKDSD